MLMVACNIYTSVENTPIIYFIICSYHFNAIKIVHNKTCSVPHQ